MASYFEMGGYAGYVWPAYILTALVLIGLVVASLRTLRSREAELRLIEETRPQRRRRGKPVAAAEEAPR